MRSMSSARRGEDGAWAYLDEAAGAWAQLARLERSSAILKREVQTVDVRLPDRLVLRVNPEVPKEAPPPKKGRPSAKNT